MVLKAIKLDEETVRRRRACLAHLTPWQHWHLCGGRDVNGQRGGCKALERGWKSGLLVRDNSVLRSVGSSNRRETSAPSTVVKPCGDSNYTLLSLPSLASFHVFLALFLYATRQPALTFPTRVEEPLQCQLCGWGREGWDGGGRYASWALYCY